MICCRSYNDPQSVSSVSYKMTSANDTGHLSVLLIMQVEKNEIAWSLYNTWYHYLTKNIDE